MSIDVVNKVALIREQIYVIRVQVVYVLHTACPPADDRKDATQTPVD